MTRQNIILARQQTPTTSSLSSGILQRKCDACGQHTIAGVKCEECQKKRSHLQRRSTNQAEPSEVPPIVHEVLRSPGQALAPTTRTLMESRFGHDFSWVRIHADTKAAHSAQAVNALAYTVGSKIIFGENQYQPHTTSGQSLLAHELTHVVQQRSFHHPANYSGLQIGAADSSYEREAQAVSNRIIQGQITATSELGYSQYPQVSKFTLQRACKPESFYRGASNYCRDDTFSPKTHPGKTCYRQIPVRDSYFSCPPGQHVCFDAKGTCEESPDRSSLAEKKEADGSCNWNSYCVAEHTAVDFVPAIVDQAVEPFREIGRELKKGLDWRNWIPFGGRVLGRRY